jgi:hypothetical protein
MKRTKIIISLLAFAILLSDCSNTSYPASSLIPYSKPGIPYPGSGLEAQLEQSK